MIINVQSISEIRKKYQNLFLVQGQRKFLSTRERTSHFPGFVSNIKLAPRTTTSNGIWKSAGLKAWTESIYQKAHSMVIQSPNATACAFTQLPMYSYYSGEIRALRYGTQNTKDDELHCDQSSIVRTALTQSINFNRATR